MLSRKDIFGKCVRIRFVHGKGNRKKDTNSEGVPPPSLSNGVSLSDESSIFLLGVSGARSGKANGDLRF